VSLVNDMLRDLDQRRKSPDSSSSSVNLMPASDMPVEKKNRILLIATGGLVVLVAGLAYLWSQQTGVSEPRQLNISAPMAQTAPTPAVNSSDEEQSIAEVEVEQQDSEAAEMSAVPEVQPDRPEPTPMIASAETGIAVGETPDVSRVGQTSVTPAENESRVDSPPAQNTTTPAPAPETTLAMITPATSSTATANTPTSVVNQPPPASVKNDAQMSADQQDTLAVQAALRMIADSNTSGAYAHLEQHILQNRYAHHARETYAKLLMNEGELLAAYNLAESGLGLAPNHAGYKKVKARILIADGQLGNAVELLSSRAPSVNSDLEYHEILATAQLASRDYQGALITYTSLVQQDQSQGKWWYGYAAAQDSLGNIRAARQAYNRAVQQSSLSPNLRRRSQERLAALSD